MKCINIGFAKVAYNVLNSLNGDGFVTMKPGYPDLRLELFGTFETKWTIVMHLHNEREAEVLIVEPRQTKGAGWGNSNRVCKQIVRQKW